MTKTDSKFLRNIFLRATKLCDSWKDPRYDPYKCLAGEGGYDEQMASRALNATTRTFMCQQILDLKYRSHKSYETIAITVNATIDDVKRIDKKAIYAWYYEYTKLLCDLDNYSIYDFVPSISDSAGYITDYRFNLWDKYNISTVQDLIDSINIYGYTLLLINDYHRFTWKSFNDVLHLLDIIGLEYNDPIEPFLGHIKTCLYNLAIDNDPYRYLDYDRFCVPVYDEIVNDVITGSHDITDEYSDLSRIINYLSDDKVEFIKRDLESFKQQLIYKGFLVEY